MIDIKAVNYFTHNILLKSSKPDVKPLNINIGNSILSDIINCFDQLNSSKIVRKFNSKNLKYTPKKRFLNFINRDKISIILLPPLISLCSLFLISSTFIYFYNIGDDKEENALINSKKITNSINTINTIL